MKIHKLKLNTKYYEDSERGIKTFEIRKNDRDYKMAEYSAVEEIKSRYRQQKRNLLSDTE